MAFSFSFVKSKATIIQIITNETKEAAQEPNPKKGKKANTVKKTNKGKKTNTVKKVKGKAKAKTGKR